MVQDGREIEWKYELDVAAAEPRWSSLAKKLPKGTRVETGPSHDLDATYFDTADHRLFHAGWTLRRRTGGDDAGWHLKVPLDVDERYEMRRALGRSARTTPIALRRMAWMHLRDETPVPIAHIATARTTRRIVTADGTVLAEIADDAVTAEQIAAADSTSPVIWREFEVELVDGDRALLKRIDTWLRSRGMQDPVAPTKLSRVLGSRPGTSPGGQAPRLKPSSPAGDVLQRYLAEQVAEIHTYDPRVRLRQGDAVHKMRVAARRLKSALRTFAPLLSGEAIEPLREELSWLAGELGHARDAEVQAERLRAALVHELEHGHVTTRIGNSLQQHADREARATAAAVLTLLDGERYHALVASLDELIAHPPMTDKAGRTARKALRPKVSKAYDDVREAMKIALRLPDGPARDDALHHGRKAAKRARYAAEAVGPAFGKPAAAFASAMEGLQEELGDYHDGVVMSRRLQEHGLAEQTTAGAFAYGRIHARQEAQRAGHDARIEKAWKRSSKTALRDWLG